MNIGEKIIAHLKVKLSFAYSSNKLALNADATTVTIHQSFANKLLVSKLQAC